MIVVSCLILWTFFAEVSDRRPCVVQVLTSDKRRYKEVKKYAEIEFFCISLSSSGLFMGALDYEINRIPVISIKGVKTNQWTSRECILLENESWDVCEKQKDVTLYDAGDGEDSNYIIMRAEPSPGFTEIHILYGRFNSTFIGLYMFCVLQNLSPIVLPWCCIIESIVFRDSWVRSNLQLFF